MVPLRRRPGVGSMLGSSPKAPFSVFQKHLLKMLHLSTLSPSDPAGILQSFFHKLYHSFPSPTLSFLPLLLHSSGFRKPFCPESHRHFPCQLSDCISVRERRLC